MSYSGESDITINDRTGFNIATVISFREWESKIGFSFEPGYTLKGITTNTDSIDYKFHYLTIPFLIDFYPIQKLKISAGPEIGLLAGAKKYSINDSTRVSPLNTSYNNRFELSGTISASYSLDYFIDLGVRYNVGFTEISGYDPRLERRNIKNKYFQVFVLFKIAN